GERSVVSHCYLLSRAAAGRAVPLLLCRPPRSSLADSRPVPPSVHRNAFSARSPRRGRQLRRVRDGKPRPSPRWRWLLLAAHRACPVQLATPCCGDGAFPEHRTRPRPRPSILRTKPLRTLAVFAPKSLAGGRRGKGRRREFRASRQCQGPRLESASPCLWAAHADRSARCHVAPPAPHASPRPAPATPPGHRLGRRGGGIRWERGGRCGGAKRGRPGASR